MKARARNALRATRWQAWRLASQLRPISDRVAVRVGRRLTRAGSRLLLYPHRDEQVDFPQPYEMDGRRVDVVADLAEYTDLTREQVTALIRRRHDSFRVEWHARPVALENETWFYLSSRAYLFANAVHDPGEVIEELALRLRPAARVLDFGGGTGNLALVLALLGHMVEYVEVSALQKDFVRYRAQKYGVGDTLLVRDRWEALPRTAYDMVCAFDVLEHVPNLASLLEGELLPAVAEGGLLAESSPFVANLSNPMHHEDDVDFETLLDSAGFALEKDTPHVRIWRSGPARSYS
jgi:2-polyprenyl-3-methyl-5-hydroxy-6-metoxy-1,4-benzoquinol methylase